MEIAPGLNLDLVGARPAAGLVKEYAAAYQEVEQERARLTAVLGRLLRDKGDTGIAEETDRTKLVLGPYDPIAKVFSVEKTNGQAHLRRQGKTVPEKVEHIGTQPVGAGEVNAFWFPKGQLYMNVFSPTMKRTNYTRHTLRQSDGSIILYHDGIPLLKKSGDGKDAWLFDLEGKNTTYWKRRGAHTVFGIVYATGNYIEMVLDKQDHPSLYRTGKRMRIGNRLHDTIQTVHLLDGQGAPAMTLLDDKHVVAVQRGSAAAREVENGLRQIQGLYSSFAQDLEQLEDLSKDSRASSAQ